MKPYNAIIITPNTPEITNILYSEGLYFDCTGESIVIPTITADLIDVMYYHRILREANVDYDYIKRGYWE